MHVDDEAGEGPEGDDDEPTLSLSLPSGSQDDSINHSAGDQMRSAKRLGVFWPLKPTYNKHLRKRLGPVKRAALTTHNGEVGAILQKMKNIIINKTKIIPK